MMAVIRSPATLTPVAPTEIVTLEVGGQSVSVSNPGKIFFPEAGVTKLDLIRYYLSVADGAVRGVLDRPMAMKRWPNGATATSSSRSGPLTSCRSSCGR